MSHELLTRDNLHLSRFKTDHHVAPYGSGDRYNQPIPEAVTGYVTESLSGNSLRAYRSDLDQFRCWGGAIPATDSTIAAYLADHAETHSAATLTRWLASLAKAHRTAGFTSPTASELVKATLRGIKRKHGAAQDQATPLLRDDLYQVLSNMGDSPKDVRDCALLLIGFAGGFRRSELVGLDYSDIEHVEQGIIISLRRSKTDQFGIGRKVGIPYGRFRHCPIKSLDQWLTLSDAREGSIFRSLNRHGQLLGRRLSGEAVSIIIKERVAAAGLDPSGYSGHSLRAGFATSAAQAGVSPWKIRQTTGHASDAMLNRYIRDSELFTGNAAGAIL